MPPIPISASKAASLWLRSVEAGRPPNEMNRTARIATCGETMHVTSFRQGCEKLLLGR